MTWQKEKKKGGGEEPFDIVRRGDKSTGLIQERDDLGLSGILSNVTLNNLNDKFTLGALEESQRNRRNWEDVQRLEDFIKNLGWMEGLAHRVSCSQRTSGFSFFKM